MKHYALPYHFPNPSAAANSQEPFEYMDAESEVEHIEDVKLEHGTGLDGRDENNASLSFSGSVSLEGEHLDSKVEDNLSPHPILPPPYPKTLNYGNFPCNHPFHYEMAPPPPDPHSYFHNEHNHMNLYAGLERHFPVPVPHREGWYNYRRYRPSIALGIDPRAEFQPLNTQSGALDQDNLNGMEQYPLALDNPQWHWTNAEVRQWLTGILRVKCGRKPEDAKRLAETMFDHGFGPALFTTDRPTWESYLGPKDGGSIYAWILALRTANGAVPNTVEFQG